MLLLLLGIVLMDLFMKTNFPRTPLSELFTGHMYPQSRPILRLPMSTIFTPESFSLATEFMMKNANRDPLGRDREPFFSAIHAEARHVTQPDRGPLGSLF